MTTKLFLHDVRAKAIKIEAKISNDSRWIDLIIGDFEITMFAETPEEYERLKNFFMVEDEHDRAISGAQFRALQEENVPW